MLIHHRFLLWFSPFILGSIAFEIAWYLLVRKRSYPWWETFTSIGIYLLRVPARLGDSLASAAPSPMQPALAAGGCTGAPSPHGRPRAF
jgi:hypothetical protein